MNAEKDLKDIKDIADVISKIDNLERLQKYPDRQGMIEALKDAKNTAFVSILGLELIQGGRFVPFEKFSDDELYNKLSQYKEGLKLHGIRMIGEKAFSELRKTKG